jgi:hypothetical protein
LKHCFPNLPFTYSLPAFDETGHFLRFLGIDTDADLGPFGRLLARGDFGSQLHILDSMLPPPESTEIRVLLLHHSRMFGEPLWNSQLSMFDAARRALDEFLVRHNIKVILCGHTHFARVEEFRAEQSNGQTLDVLECCCGTTTQRDYVPPTWRTFWRKWPVWRFSPNSLLVHRLIEEDGMINWRTEQYVRKSGGFELDRGHPDFPVK